MSGASGSGRRPDGPGRIRTVPFGARVPWGLVEELPEVPGYALEALLGSGGSGRVFAGTDGDGKKVAVKVVDLTRLGEADGRDRLAREVDVLGRLSHPALVPLLDAKLDREFPFLVFPLYEGGDLAARLEAGPLAPEQVRALGLQVLGALETMHASGALHRDVKTANVFLDAAGRAVLGDLGLVRAEGHDALTTQGVALGTLPFMAPELRQGDPASPASDLFALGVVLLDAAGGGRPVITLEEVVISHRGRPPGFTPALDGLVRRMLSVKPGDRPEAAEVRAVLEEDAGDLEDAATLSLTVDEAARLAELARRGAGDDRPVLPSREVPEPPSGRIDPRRVALPLGGVVLVAALLGFVGSSGPPAPTLAPPAPPTRVAQETDLAALLEHLEARLGEEARRLREGEPGRPGQAHVLRWLAEGNDPGELPELVRGRLRRHAALLEAAGEPAAYAPLLDAPALDPDGDAAGALRSRADSLGR